MATRRTDDGLRFDHGAQYFTVRSDIFHHEVDAWVHDDIVQRWDGRITVLERGQLTQSKSETERFVAVPAMNAICKHLATDRQIRLQTQIAQIERSGTGWILSDERRSVLGEYDIVIVSAPASQAAALLSAAPQLAGAAGRIAMHPCWAVMMAFDESLSLEFDAAFVHESPLTWIARSSSKPERQSKPETWVLHASPEWSRRHLEASPSEIEALLRSEFWTATAAAARLPCFCTAHRWRFALPAEPLSERCLFDTERRIGACGDWCGGPRVEGAYLSGVAAADRVLDLLR